ncbi:PRC-barrel domain-containing protein [Microvirga sp. M2]|uniref:PRC-barrel domain-containing protein n=1 Tax=Microvirga sp. M2 TaxID=3073270 RepID=UPI0039C1A852
MNYLIAPIVITALVIGTGVMAQQAPQPSAPAPRPAAQPCLNDLTAFGERMDKDGFWLNGYGYRWAYGNPPAVVAPWGTLTEFGIDAPRFQIQTLYSTASVLARRGNEQACQTVLSELGAVYDQRVAQLRQAGIEPGQVISWRQRLLLEAQPVTQLGRALSIDDLSGADVRNLQDERLGSINDMVLNPNTGAVSHVVIARGGFLGIGRDYIAVPWQYFRATPGLNVLVLNVSRDVIENAPQVEPNMGPAAFEQVRPQIDQYWQQHVRS